VHAESKEKKIMKKPLALIKIAFGVAAYPTATVQNRASPGKTNLFVW